MDVELKIYICLCSSLRSKNCSEIRKMDEEEEYLTQIFLKVVSASIVAITLDKKSEQRRDTE